MRREYPEFKVRNIYFVDNEKLEEIRGYNKLYLTNEQIAALDRLKESLKPLKSLSAQKLGKSRRKKE